MNKQSKIDTDSFRILFFFTAIAFCLRVSYVLWAPIEFRFDEIRYWTEIQSLIDHGTFVSSKGYAHDMPLTAIILAIVIKVTGTGIYGAKILLAFVSATTVFIIGRITFLLHPSRQSVIYAGTVATVYPFFIYYSSLLLSETFFLFTFSLFFYLTLQDSKKKCLFSGVVAGVSHLVRPTLMYFMVVIWLWQYIVFKIRWKIVLAGILLFFIVILPWGFRNQKVLGKFVIGTTGIGQVLWEGNNPWNENGGTAGDFNDRSLYLQNLPAGLSDVQKDNWKKERAILFITENPQHFLKLCWKRFLRFWHLWPNFHWFDHGVYKWVSLLSFGPVLLLSIISLWVLRNRWRVTGPIWLVIGYYTLVHTITIGSIRYRLPLEPLLIALACATTAKLFPAREVAILKRQQGD